MPQEDKPKKSKSKSSKPDKDSEVTRDSDDVNYADLVNEVVDGIGFLGDLGSNSIVLNTDESKPKASANNGPIKRWGDKKREIPHATKK